MRTFPFLPTLSCFFLFFLLSCASSKPSSVYDNHKKTVVVKTHDGYTYDLPWYEVKDGYLVSILNTSRIVLDREQIIEVAIDNHEHKKVELDEALSHDGTVSLIAFDSGQRVHNYEFFELKEVKGQVVGFTSTNGFAANITIPLNNVKDIDVKEIRQMDDTTKRIIGWSLLIALEYIAVANGGESVIFWLY